MGMTFYCFIAAQFFERAGLKWNPSDPGIFSLRETLEKGIRAGCHSSFHKRPKLAQIRREGCGVRMPHPAPIRPTQRPTGQTELESLGDSMTEENNSSLLQHRKTRQVAESMTGQRPVSFSPFDF